MLLLCAEIQGFVRAPSPGQSALPAMPLPTVTPSRQLLERLAECCFAAMVYLTEEVLKAFTGEFDLATVVHLKMSRRAGSGHDEVAYGMPHMLHAIPGCTLQSVRMFDATRV